MALGLGKKAAEALGIKLSDIERVAMLAPHNYGHWDSTRHKFQRLFPKTDKWIQSCHNMPGYDDCVMEMFNELLEGCGIEAIRGWYVDSYYHDVNAVYVNTGDTYALTILYDCNADRYMVTSWGDFVERYDKRYGVE